MAEQAGPAGAPPAARTSRRRLLGQGAVLAAGGLGLAGCGGRSGVVQAGFLGTKSPSSTVVYWNLLGGGDGVRMVQMEQDWLKANPGKRLDATVLNWGAPYYTKLAMATVGRHPPDVAIMHMSRLLQFAPSGLLQELDKDELKRRGISKDTILPRLWQKAHYAGRLYAVPLDTHPWVMYYNTKLCRKAGLLDSSGRLKPIKGADQLVAALQKAKKASGSMGLSMEVQAGVGPWRCFWALYNQLQGGPFFNASATKVTVDRPKALKALTFLRDLAQKHKVMNPALDYPGSVAEFQAQRAAFLWDGDWEVATYQDAKTPFDMTLFPQIFDTQATQADSHSFVIPMHAADPGKSLDFITGMLKQSLTWAGGGHIPAYVPTLRSAAYHKLSPQSHYASEAKHINYDPPAWFSGSGADLEVQAQNIFPLILQGQLSPQAGLDQFISELEKLATVARPF
jgi:multiple sugar transport system substrate-binding protein